MLPSMNSTILDHLKDRGVSTVPALLNLSHEELHKLLQSFAASELYKVLILTHLGEQFILRIRGYTKLY
jgi:activating signal cointegrator complex subunit 3